MGLKLNIKKTEVMTIERITTLRIDKEDIKLRNSFFFF